MLNFHPGSQNQVAGESINDSGIGNKNENLSRAHKSFKVERIWAFSKEIGAGDYGNEQEVIRQLKDMEDRDRELFRKSKVNADVIEGIDSMNLKLFSYL
ncbi:hypothetical protein SLA2020_100360 [Shorea laevis]